ncbi:uncharacterized protein [Coffea arabica]|uniref:Uncharacterized protein n=1 Tax=Coffea arabica TaxID=13443 RepID=A0ABM4V9H8_COFAR
MAEREGLWAGLRNDKEALLPWFIVGNFNVITREEEKKVGVPFRPGEGVELLSFMSIVGVVDMGFSGSNFMWCNNRQGRAGIWKHLDRLLSDRSAVEMDINFRVQYLIRAPSNHALLLLSTVTRLVNCPKPFRFLNCSTMHESLLEVVRLNWHVEFVGDPLYVLAAKLCRVKKALKAWSRESFGDIFEKVKTAEEEVAQAEICFNKDPSELHQICLNEKRALLTHAQVNEDLFWRQKIRAVWLTGRDKIIRCFHAYVSKWRKKSVIHRIISQYGEWLEREDDISKEAVFSFQQLLADQSGLSSAPVSDVIPKLLTD